MTVEELLHMPSLRGLQLIAGNAGIHRRISTVTVIDTPDGSIWLKGSEFVITTAYAIKDDSCLMTELIQQLVSRKASGLGIKTGRFIKRIPDEAIALADQLDFPLVSIPDEYAFCDIINPALSMIVNRQSTQLMRSSQIHRKFLELAVDNASVTEILRTLSGLLGRPAVFVDIHFRKLYFSDPNSVPARALGELRFEDLTPEVVARYERHDVANKTETFGYILLDEGEGAEPDLYVSQTALEHASIVLILRMQVRISNQHIEEKYRETFLEDLLLNNVKAETEIHNRAQLYGWRFDHGGQVVVIDINNIKKYYLKSLDPRTNERLETFTRSIFETSIQAMLSIFPDAKYYKQSDLIVFIVSTSSTDPTALHRPLEEIFQQIRQRIASRVSFTITMGVGEYCSNIRDIHQSYTQARTAINLGYQLELFDCVLFYSQLGIYRLLASMDHTTEFADFCMRYIQPLEAYDAKNHTSLVETLRAVVRCGWNLKSASDALFIHYNSVKYRFHKICEILGLDLREHENQLAVEIALKMHMVDSRRWL